MALFGSKSSTEKQSESSTSSFIPPSSRTSKSSSVPEPPLQVNMIGKGANIEGTVKVKGDVRVGGKVKGEVHVEGKLVITPEGSIEGLIRTQEAEVGGRIKGDIICHGRLTLHKSTHLEGNIVAAKLVIEDGAIFIGQCEMGAQALKATGMVPPSAKKSNAPAKEAAPIAPIKKEAVSVGSVLPAKSKFEPTVAQK